MSYKYTERYKKVDKELTEHAKEHGGTFPFGGCKECGRIAKEWLDASLEQKKENTKRISIMKQRNKKR